MAAELLRPNVVRRRTVSVCPSGQGAGASEELIGLVTVNVSPQARQRNS